MRKSSLIMDSSLHSQIQLLLGLLSSTRTILLGILGSQSLCFHGLGFFNLTCATQTFSLRSSFTRFSLCLQSTNTCLFSLSFVDVFHQNTLILELITFNFEVQLVEKISVNLIGFPVAFQKATENAH